MNLDYQGTRSYQIWISGTRRSSVLTAVSISGPSCQPADICSLESPTQWKWHSEENNDKELTDFSLLPAVTNTQVTHIIPKSSLGPFLGDVALWMTGFLVNDSSEVGLSLQDKNCEHRRLSLPDPKLGFKICGGLQKSAS